MSHPSSVRLSLRFLIPLLLALAAFAYVSVPLTDSLMQRWFVRDLDIRSSAIAGNVQEQMTTLAATRSEPRILALFNKMLQDERLYGVGLCVAAPTPRSSRRRTFRAR
jgi:trehalose 6-phosphate synthase